MEAHARRLRDRYPEIRRILWYGSWVRGDATPSSDVDLCVVLAADPRPHRDRVPDFLPETFPTGIDLSVVTEAELSALEKNAPGWHGAIVGGRQL